MRLRIDLVAKFIKAVRPDVLCLQETKCPDDAFPLKRFKRLGYEHVALNGQKGYHGVAVLSRLPFETHRRAGLLRQDRLPPRLGACSARRAGLRDPVTLHNFYVPAGGDDARPGGQSEIRAQARVPRRDARLRAHALPARDQRSILVGDLNVAPLEHDVWSHKQMLQGRLAHADRMREAHRRAEGRRLDRRHAHARAASRRSSTPGGAIARPTGQTADKGRRLDHIWVVAGARPTGSPTSRSRKDARGWARPSDHVPVTATLDV